MRLLFPTFVGIAKTFLGTYDTIPGQKNQKEVLPLEKSAANFRS
jgi:hypothetical protein